MSSRGKSGSCSWNGEAGTPANAFGTAGLSATGEAAGSATVGLATGEGPLVATPTGLGTFLVPVVALSGVGELRGAALAAPDAREGLAPLMETPTGREIPAGVVADDEAATPNRWEPAGELPLTPTTAAGAAPGVRAEGATEADPVADVGTAEACATDEAVGALDADVGAAEAREADEPTVAAVAPGAAAAVVAIVPVAVPEAEEAATGLAADAPSAGVAVAEVDARAAAPDA